MARHRKHLAAGRTERKVVAQQPVGKSYFDIVRSLTDDPKMLESIERVERRRRSTNVKNASKQPRT
jgi:hypothetical protein